MVDSEKALDMPLDDIIAATLNGKGVKRNSYDTKSSQKDKKRSSTGGDEWRKGGYNGKEDWKNKKAKWTGGDGASGGNKWEKPAGSADGGSWGWKKQTQDWGNKSFGAGGSSGGSAGGWAKQDTWSAPKSKDYSWGSGGGNTASKTWWQDEEEPGRRKTASTTESWTPGGQQYDDGQRQLRRRTKVDPPPTQGSTVTRTANLQPVRGGAGRYDDGPRSVKVTNVPLDLDWRDIKDAFEVEAGKIHHCELNRGIALLRFASAEDAKRAVKMFDRGELNGRTIHVELERE